MLIHQSYRYELKPNNKQKTCLSKHAGTARFTYNWGLNRRIEEYEKEGKSSNAIKQHRQLNLLKKTDFPWMYEVSKCAPQEALRNLDCAFKNFWRGLKSGKKIGFPKFKKKYVYDSFRLTGSIHVLRKSVMLPRLGEIRTKEKTDLKGRLLSATVSREADRWFVSLAVERERELKKQKGKEAEGVDLGIDSFVTFSNGRKITSPKPLEKALKSLKRRSKNHSRKKLGSMNRKKSALTLARLHRKIKNKRRDSSHKTSTSLAKTKSRIGVEDLNVQGMIRNRHLSRQIADCGWGKFIEMLSYKTKWYGSELIKAPRFYPSSKLCSGCKTIKKELKLSEREFICERCDLVIDRDVNAARNLKELATASFAESEACGDTTDGGIPNDWESTSQVPVKQEADTKYPPGIFG